MTIYNYYLQLLENLEPTNKNAFDEYKSIILTKQVERQKFVTNEHHIYPKKFPDGKQYEDDRANIVTLTYYWHLMAHDALARAFDGHRCSKISKVAYGGFVSTVFLLKKYTSTEEIKSLSEKRIQELYSLARERNGKMKRGITLSEEHKRKIGDGCRGERNGMYGRKHSEETLKKISASLRGKRWVYDTKEDRSVYLDGEEAERLVRENPDRYRFGRPEYISRKSREINLGKTNVYDMLEDKTLRIPKEEAERLVRENPDRFRFGCKKYRTKKLVCENPELEWDK